MRPNAISAICLILTMKLENLWPQLDICLSDVPDDGPAYEKYKLAHQTFMKIVREFKLLDKATKESIWQSYGPSHRQIPTFLYSEYEIY
jgi:hypothetical protein